MSATEWSELAVSGLPTGTVTLLLADVEGSTRLWETQPEAMTAAIARLDSTLAELITIHDGVRPVEQGDGDSFVLAFSRASDAVACALALQRAPLAPIRLRIGVNTGEIQLRDEGNYIGPTINRTARLRDLGHGGQTLLSGATESMIVDHLPDDAWLNDLGSHPLRDLPRPERVVQLCHPDIRNEFSPLRTTKAPVVQHFPTQLTSFVGREAQMKDVRQMLADNRLVTLTGAGGAGKTRMAIQVGGQVSSDFRDGAWYVDLAPIADPDSVPITVSRALGLPDQPGRSTMDSIVKFIDDREIFVVLDNCEHVLDASAKLVIVLLDSCAGLTLLATSREPIGVAGEVTWRVPSLSLADEAIELFAERARLTAPDFVVDGANADAVVEICRRLDGMPLAIELAAARVRALSVTEILDSLHDRFRLLTGGARTAVQRQQTLRASVDWSHALLTEPERVLFRRLSVFMGGFDLDAAQSVAGGGEVERYQVLDQLTLLVDKSLVVTEKTTRRTRYRLLETVRQYAQEKLGESGEANAVRTSHRDYYCDLVAALDDLAVGFNQELLERPATEIDNLRAAFTWCRENAEPERALELASSLGPLWITRGAIKEGVDWLDAALNDYGGRSAGGGSALEARGLADRASLKAYFGATDSTDPEVQAGALADEIKSANRALAIAREIGDPALLLRTLSARGAITSFSAAMAKPFFDEAAAIARALGDRWRLCRILSLQSFGEIIAGNPVAARTLAQEGCDLAESAGFRFAARSSRWTLGWALWLQGDLAASIKAYDEVIAEAEGDHDVVIYVYGRLSRATTLAYAGEVARARLDAEAVSESAAEIGGLVAGLGYSAFRAVALADGDSAAALNTSEIAWQFIRVAPDTGAVNLSPLAQAALTAGDVTTARRWAEQAVAETKGWHRAAALSARARVALAEGDSEIAEQDAHESLAVTSSVKAYLGVADTLEVLGRTATVSESYAEAARLFGAADAARQGTGEVRFKLYDADFESAVATLRDAMDAKDFEAAWAEGAALSADEAIAYAQRGRGERKRPSAGWGSLTPTELDVVRLVKDGLGNKDIAARLFISHRTVQTHLTHVYTKLGMTSRVQLAQEAARHA
jgi:predicted ATPase/class 3 adenylate cyclase/DNA-binding CsgD family transcriptional regulator